MARKVVAKAARVIDDPGGVRVEYVALGSIARAKRNPKAHVVAKIQDSIRRFGFVLPLTEDASTGRLVAGHGRLEALQGMLEAKEAAPARIKEDGGDWLVPVLRGVAFENEAEAEAYLLADNKLSEIGGWDDAMLVEMLKDIPEGPRSVAGFDPADLDALIAKIAEPPVKPTIEDPGADAGDPAEEVHGVVSELDGRFTLRVGNCIEQMKEIPDGSVNCCVTSPPYWGLRDYGTATWEGGDPGCDHRHQLGGEGSTSTKQNTSTGTQTMQYREKCEKCGAKRIDDQLGLEETPDEYIGKMVEVFREVRRVLADDGTLWLNLGDSYTGNASPGGKATKGATLGSFGEGGPDDQKIGLTKRGHGLKSGDLVGIPWSVAFALRADGWYLRSEIIWHKPNPMPESVTSRPTKSHEQIFLLAKSAKYFYDADSVREECIHDRGGGLSHRSTMKHRVVGRQVKGPDAKVNPLGRNKRTVWTIATTPYSGAHFAVFPPELPLECILAGCPEGGLVFDPFAGACTTGLAALSAGRRFIGTELNPKYAAMARRRILAAIT